MIELEININRTHIIERVQAIRIHPLRRPNVGEVCTYEVHIIDEQSEPIATLKFPYGSATGLCIEMLKLSQEYFARKELDV